MNAVRSCVIQHFYADYAGTDGVESPMLFWEDDACKRMQAVPTLSPNMPAATFSASYDACGPRHSGGF